MVLRIKKIFSDAKAPKYAKKGDAGLDLFAYSKSVENDKTIYGTGIAVEIPEGYVGLIFPRSSIVNKTLTLSNSVGVIDSGYRGEVRVVFNHIKDRHKEHLETRPIYDDYNANSLSFKEVVVYTPDINHYEIGERVAQMVIVPYVFVTVEEAEDLTASDRGAGGFGSTGN